MAQPEEDLLPVKVVAPVFGVAEETVRGWLRTGRIGGTRTPGGQWRVYGSALRTYISARTPAGAEQEGAREITHG